MQIIPPATLRLHTTGTPTYVSPTWATGQTYTANQSIVRVETSSGWWDDYGCIATHVSASGYGVLETINKYWTYRGPSAIASGATPTTNVALTTMSPWQSGTATSVDDVVYDASDSHEYVAVTAITSGDNTIRPSLAVKSSDRLIASRWLDIGAANAWAPIDYQTSSILKGLNSSGTIVDPVFKVSCNAGYWNRVALTGLYNVASITIKVYVSGSLTETKTATLTAGTYSIRPETAVINITALSTAADIEVTLTRDVSTIVPTCGKVILGYGYELAQTQWGIETGILSFSKKERDPVFGTVKLVKRKSAKRLRASCTIKTASVTGDIAYRVIANRDGQACFFDFNNSDTSYDRMRFFGFITDFSITPLTPSYELLTISTEGLVGS
jgi:hypothetical protein